MRLILADINGRQLADAGTSEPGWLHFRDERTYAQGQKQPDTVGEVLRP